MRLDESSILALAPERLLNQRVSRYGGDGMDVSMRDLTTDDARHVAKLYGALSTLLGELREALGVPAGDGRLPHRAWSPWACAMTARSTGSHGSM